MKHWEGAAGAYERSFARLCSGTVETMVELLGPAGSSGLVLDIGTGTGTVAAATRLAGHQVIGMDSEVSMVELARRRHPAIAFVQAALPHLPCPDAIFSAITANFVINHAPDPRRAVRELLRTLRVGGRLVATVWPSEVSTMNQLWNEVMQRAGVAPLASLRLPASLDFERTVAGFAGLFLEAGAKVDGQEISWTFEVDRDDLWIAVEAGIAGVGQAYRAQTPELQQRMRETYLALTAERFPSGVLELPSTALIATAERL